MSVAELVAGPSSLLGPEELRAYASDAPPFLRASLRAARADRLAWAFEAAYEAAIEALTGEPGPASLCVTEAGGNSPAAIETTLRRDGGGWRIDGEKTFATGRSTTLWVLVSAGQEGGRKDLRLARVRATAPGVSRVELPPAPFVPEIPHHRVELRGVAVSEADLLRGDGWVRYVKPFRTVEDVHVLGAALAFLVGTGRRHGWPAPLLEDLLAGWCALAHLAGLAPDDPGVHLALAGVVRQVHQASLPWDLCPPEDAARWARDRVILGVAGRARALRRERAWALVKGEAP